MIKKKKLFKIKRPHVLVPMCLDFYHHGHANILIRAKKYGNIILGIVSDEGIKSYKKKYPINSYKDRKKIASTLKDIKYIFKIKSPREFSKIAKRFKFDYFVHGDDWKTGIQAPHRKKLIATMLTWGGKVIDVPYTKKISSSKIKSKLKI